MSVFPSGPSIIADPLPPVACRPPEFEPIQPGPEQRYLPTGEYSWSPDLDWWRDFTHDNDIKFTARPPLRPW